MSSSEKKRGRNQSYQQGRGGKLPTKKGENLGHMSAPRDQVRERQKHCKSGQRKIY